MPENAPQKPPASVVVGALAIAILVAYNIVLVLLDLTRGFVPSGVTLFYLVWGIVVLWGTPLRSRLAWQMARIVSFCAGVLAGIVALFFLLTHAFVGRDLWLAAWGLFVAIDMLAVFFLFGRPTAIGYFRLRERHKRVGCLWGGENGSDKSFDPFVTPGGNAQ
jgi:predicted MFS family arabinose efflux permease